MLEEWRVAECQLNRKAPKRPYVNLFRIMDTLSDLWRDKIDRASLSISIFLLLAQKNTKAHVTDLKRSIRLEENVVGLDIAVQDVLVVHGK